MFRGEELPAHSTAGSDPGRNQVTVLGVVRGWKVYGSRIEVDENATQEQIVRKEWTQSRQVQVEQGDRERDRRGS